MNKNLSILVGSDNRYPIVNHTLRVSHSFFDKIIIIYNTLDEYIDNYDFNLYKNVYVYKIKKYFGELESCRRAMLYHSPKNEWLFWLDSDESLSSELLNNINFILEKADSIGPCVGYIPYVEHLYDNINETNSYRNNPINLDVIPKNESELSSKPWFSAPRLIKNLDMYITSNFGGHETIMYKKNEYNKMYYIPQYIIHHKSTDAIAQSCFYHLFTTPWQHVNYKEWDQILRSEEYILLREFQLKWKVYTSNDINHKYINCDEEFFDNLKNMLNLFSKSDINVFKWMSNLLNTNFKFETKFEKCLDKKCCNYENFI